MFKRSLFLVTLLGLPFESLAQEQKEFQADLRTFYFNGERDDRQNREALAVGGILKYTSPQINKLRASAAFYGSYNLLNTTQSDTLRVKNGSTVTDSSDIAGNSELIQSDGSSISVLGEAYIEYDNFNTLVRIGRQRLNTPLLNDYYNRFLPNSFEAALLENSSLAQTKISLAVVNRWKYKADEEFRSMGGTLAENKKLFFAGLQNRSLQNISLEGWFYRLDDAFDSYYFKSSYEKQNFISDLKLSTAVHYLKQDESGDMLLGNLDTYLFGTKISLQSEKLTLTCMADKVGKDTIRGSGTDYRDLGFSKFVNFTDIQIDGEALNAGAFSYGAVVGYKFSPKYKAALKYVHIDQDTQKQLNSYTPNKRADSDEYNIDMRYKTSKTSQVRVRLAQIDYASNPSITNEYDEINLRIIYDYRFKI